jgi:hypothetical protein
MSEIASIIAITQLHSDLVLTKPSSRRKKTVVRAIRLTEELDQSLQAEAESKGITVSSLISSIFTRRETFDRSAERIGTVIFRKLFENLLAAVSEEDFKKAYPPIVDGWISAVEFTTAHEATFENFWTSLENFGSYSGLFQTNAFRDEGRFRLSLYHTFGKRWSDLLEGVISENMGRLGARKLNHSSTSETVIISGETP